jgi:Cu(I)/Ag(I) efflux system protein CusF
VPQPLQNYAAMASESKPSQAPFINDLSNYVFTSTETKKVISMSKLKQIFASALFVAGALGMSLSAAADASGAMVDGVVKEVRPNGDLTIKHGKIPNLDMSAMTMVFKLSDPKLGKGVKVGDKIKIHVEEVGGKLTVTQLKK